MCHFNCFFCTIFSLIFALANSRDVTVELNIADVLSSDDLSQYPLLAQNEQKFRIVAKTFAVKPEDDAAAITTAFCDRAEKLGMKLNQETVLTQVEMFGNSQAYGGSSPYVQPATLSPVPFSFYRLDASLAGATEGLMEHVRLSIGNARSGLSRLLVTPDALEVEGMSDTFVRHLLNNLASASGTKYLEIGSWRGSTFVSALVGNEETVDSAIAVDSWNFDTDFDKSIFGTGHESLAAFEKHVAHFVADSVPWRHIRCDFRSLEDMELSGTGSSERELFNVYLFDGPHEAQDHEDALTLVQHHLTNTYVYIVDDWNDPQARAGTYRAISKLGLEVLWAEALGGGRPGYMLGPWHNGMWVGVLRKP